MKGIKEKMSEEEKCNKCKYKRYYGKDIFPCTKCISEPPVTCYDCRQYTFGECKKGIRPCKKFEWW